MSLTMIFPEKLPGLLSEGVMESPSNISHLHAACSKIGPVGYRRRLTDVPAASIPAGHSFLKRKQRTEVSPVFICTPEHIGFIFCGVFSDCLWNKYQIADQIVFLSLYKYFSSRHEEASLPSLTKPMAAPPTDCPSMATLAFSPQEDIIENYTIELFYQTAQSIIYSGTKKNHKEHWNLSPEYPRCCQTRISTVFLKNN